MNLENHKYAGFDQAILLHTLIRRNDPNRKYAFTPERANEFLAEQKAEEVRNFVDLLNARIQSLAGKTS